MLTESVCCSGQGVFIVISDNDLYTMSEKRFCGRSANTIGAAGYNSSVLSRSQLNLPLADCEEDCLPAIVWPNVLVVDMVMYTPR